MKRNYTHATILALTSCVAFVAPGGRSSGAQVDAIWSGGSGNWNTAANWGPAVVPSNGANTYRVKIDNGAPGLSLVSLDTSVTIDTLTIDFGDALGINNGQSLSLLGPMSNAGTLSLSSIGGNTDLRINADLSLTSGGTVALSNSGTNRIISASGASRLTNVDNLIRGSGQLGANLMGVTNQAVIQADQPVALTIDPSATGVINNGTLRATNGATLVLGVGDFDNTTGTIEAQNGSTVSVIGGAVVTGGILTSAGTGAIVPSLGRLHNVTNNGLISITNSLTGVLTGTMTNNATIGLNSIGSNTDLRIDSDLTLIGGGTVAMSNSGTNRIISASGTSRLTNVNNLIRGSGQVGANLMALTNQAVIQADQPTALTIDPSATGAINTGTLRATNNATLILAAGDYDNTIGIIEAQNGSTVSVTNSAVVTGGILTSVGTGAIVPNLGRLHNVTNNGQLAFNNGLTGILTGTMTNNATISMNSIGGTTDLRIDSDVNLVGGGTVAMGDNVANRIISSTGTNRLTNNSTIRGSGQIGANLMALTNQSLIQADQPTALAIDPSATGMINNGTLRATNGATLVLGIGDFDNTGGIIEAQTGSTVSVISGAVVTGGILTSSGTGSIAPNAGRLHNVTNTGQIAISNGLTGVVTGTITNNATININSIGGNTDLRIDTDVNLIGGGTVALSNSGANRVISASGTSRLTNVDNLIHGSGQIGANLMALTNQAVIQADQATPLTIDPSSPGLTNNGTLRATNNATLVLAPGDFDNTGGVIDAQNGSTVSVTNGAVVSGGTLTSMGNGAIVPSFGRLHNVTNNGLISITNGLTGVLTGTMTNNATIALNSIGGNTDLRIDSDLTLAGGGTVTLSNTSPNRMISSTGALRLTNLSNLIHGAGQIGANLMALTNQGTIDADQATGLTIDPVDAGGFVNIGQLKVTGAGGLAIATGAFTTSGTVTINATRQLSRTGVYTQTGGTTLADGTLAATGGVALQGGVLKGTGPVSNAVTNTGGTILPGDSPGALVITGPLTQTTGGALYIELGGTTPVTQHDQLQISGAASIAGTLRVNAVNGFVPTLSQTFVILTTLARTGTFDQIQTFGFPPGLTIQAIYNATNITLQVVAGSSARLGDMNCDSAVDVIDIPLFIQAVLDPATYTANNPSCFVVRADMNSDGFIDGRDIPVFTRCVTGGGCP